MNQATRGQDQNDPPPQPLSIQQQQQQAPAQVVNSSNPGNPVIMNEYNIQFSKSNHTNSTEMEEQ